jgi:hypothetical protein
MEHHLDIIIKLGTLLAGFCGIAKWIVHRIEKGQQVIIEQHRKDMKLMKKRDKKRVSKYQCEKLRAQCPCNNNLKGKNEK